jgi:hypothetical protein
MLFTDVELKEAVSAPGVAVAAYVMLTSERRDFNILIFTI